MRLCSCAAGQHHGCNLEAFAVAAKLVVIAHLPVMLIEGILTMFCVSFLRKVRPEMFGEIR